MTERAPETPRTPGTPEAALATPEVEHLDAEIGADPAVAPLAARAPVSDESPAFAEFAIRPEIVEALAAVGITHTFAIQELTLPIALAGGDLIGQARTGTGKTLGFGVPLLNRIEIGRGKGATPQALVIAPTRELAVQVSGDLATAGKLLGARVQTIYGGRAYEPQVEALRKGADVVVGTPGRLLDLAQQGHLVLGGIGILVLDEGDEMLDLGFLPDIEKLMAMLPARRQTMLFSATMPGPIVALARKFLNQPIQIRAEQDTETPSTEHIDQFAYRAHSMDKPEMLARVLQARGRGLTMIFTRTKRSAAKVADDLLERGFAAAAVHGDLGQGAREQALRAFRSGKVDVLVATDVAARGLDVEGVTHVINYQAPDDEKTYVHRIGRTARAGASGSAITLVDWEDMPRWKMICDLLGLPFHEPPETYSTSEHLFLELDIPMEAGRNLPRSSRTRAGLDAEQVEDIGGKAPRGQKTASDRAVSRPAREPAARAERPARPANTRSRRRTRAGKPATDFADSNFADSNLADSNLADSDSADSADTTEAPAAGTKAPRRRRRASGRGSSASSQPTSDEPSAE
ncbi:MAG TPA: DEAD/DEAH box helicase [Jatrophihabitantaceae bacterium]|nr:DEAD/DEAH box helicase [Jatrophihabitantaceae bacterium]